MVRNLLNLGVILLTTSICLAGNKPAEDAVSPRPPQFVLLAFDGSLSGSMWNATREFSSELKAKGIDARFTYFISGVYFLANAFKTCYQGPNHRQGASAIGFGGQAADVLTRANNVNLAISENHEIGSHANGHFDGSKWSEQDWTQELQAFNYLVFDFFSLNGFDPKTAPWSGWLMQPADIRGFRAPVLGISDGMYTTLKALRFRYDTSKTAVPGYWPRKSELGIWNFPLASLTIAGTAMRTLSMDYNFYFAQSKGQDDAANAAIYEKQMYETYLNYFLHSYQGNRAPIHIGHHFSLWNGAAYWKAMQHFATTVCALPEVKCVTYSELTEYLEALSQQQIEDYSRGRFERARLPSQVTQLGTASNLDVRLQMNLAFSPVDKSLQLNSQLHGADGATLLAQGARLEYFIDGVRQPFRGVGLHSLKHFTAGLPMAKSIEARVYLGSNLILRRTHRLERRQDAGPSLPYRVSPEALEDRALLGDLPEAHTDESTN